MSSDPVLDTAETFRRIRGEIARRIVGQNEVVTQLLVALLAEGHALIIGVPGLAKTLLVSSLAELLSLEFKRIQFTPDLMPSDITGASIITDGGGAQDRGWRFLRGPIFANIVLADEINRTPAKTQAALMEAMEERQVTAAGRRLKMERPFFVLATQNPIDQEGTYALPVSQTDRFLLSIAIDYPSAEEEFEILERTTSAYESSLAPILDRAAVLAAIAASKRIAVAEDIVGLATRIVRRTRPLDPLAPPFVRDELAWGAGPRGVIALLDGARALALLDGRFEATREDIFGIARPALRHRLILSYAAEAEGIAPDTIVQRILELEGFPKEERPAEKPRRGWLRSLLRR